MKYVLALTIALSISMHARAIKIDIGYVWGGTMSTNCTGGGNVTNLLNQVIKYLEFKFPIRPIAIAHLTG